MIVRTLNETEGTDADVRAETWKSRRLLLARDGVGFSLHDTVLYAGTATEMHYQHHIEAVYVIEGEGELIDLATTTTYPIAPGTLYTLDAHDRHILKATTDVRCVCVFTPPLTGREVHDEHGVYPLLTEATP